MRSKRSLLNAAVLLSGGAVATLPAGLASASDGPTRVDSEVALSDESNTLLAPDPSRALACGTASSAYKYSTKILITTVDVFRHANVTGACENDAVITHVYEVRNDCTKYAWGVTYFLNKNYRFGPSTTPGTKTAFGTAECAVSIGGEIQGIGLKYTKQSNTQHAFEMQGAGAVVRKTHWTTTP